MTVLLNNTTGLTNPNISSFEIGNYSKFLENFNHVFLLGSKLCAKCTY